MRASRCNRAGRQSRPAHQEPRSAHGQGGQGARACVRQDGVDGDARPPREHQQPGAGASRRGWTRDDGALQCAAGPRRHGGGHVAARTRGCFLHVACSRWCLFVRVLLVPTSCVCLCLCLCLSVCLPACLPACLYLDIPKHPCTHHSDDGDASHARGRACRALHGGGGHRGACACDDAGWIAVGVCSYCSSPSLCRGRVPRAGETPAHAHALVREGESEKNRCRRV